MEELSTLVERAQAGDVEAYGEIVRRFQDMAYGYAYSLLGDFHLAQDAAQDAFIRAYRDLAGLRQPAAFPGWFRRIVFKQCDRIQRKWRPTVSLASEGPEPQSESPSPPEAAEKQELRDRVLAAVRSLPEHLRTATTLFYINGYAVKDIAAFLETPAGTVKRRLHDSRKQLKERMVTMVADSFKDHALPGRFTEATLERAVSEAHELNVTGKHEEAEKLMREVLQEVPGNASALRELNRALMWGRVYGQDKWGLLQQIAAQGIAIIDSGADDEQVRRDVSETLLAVPDMKAAIRFLRKWIKEEGHNVERNAKLSWALGCTGDYEHAQENTHAGRCTGRSGGRSRRASASRDAGAC